MPTRPCLHIPIYNHGSTIREVVESLAYLDLPLIITNDGSNAETRAILEQIEQDFSWVTLNHLDSVTEMAGTCSGIS